MKYDSYYARLERLGIKEVRADRKRLEKDIKEYLKGGGKIEQVPTGVSAFDDILSSWKEKDKDKDKDKGWTTLAVTQSDTSMSSKVKPSKE